MSDLDNLEALSNAEIRAKCLENGMPNVPVTDSSRKVLIKKLRVSLGGGSNSPVATGQQKKPGVRRETVHVARQLLPEKGAGGDAEPTVDSPRSKGRRTVAATLTKEPSPALAASSSAAIAEKRRLVREPVLTKTSPDERPQTSLMQITEETEMQPQQSARTQPRMGSEKEAAKQKSKQEPQHVATTTRHYLVEPEVEVNVVAQSKSTSDPPIAERRPSAEQHAHITQRRNSNPLEPPVRPNTLLHNSLIVLESDDEEDEELVRVAQMAESQQRGVGATRQLSSLSSLSSSAYRASELYAKSQYGSGSSFVRDKARVSPAPLTTFARSNPSFYGGSSSTAHQAPSAPPTRSTLSQLSSHRTPMPPCGIEQSDDNDQSDGEGDGLGTPFLSSFARNLERLKAEPLSSSSPHYRRTVAAVGGQYEPGLRRPLRRNDDDVSGALRRLWFSLDNKYKLKWKIVGVLAIIFIVLLYVILF